MNVTAEEEYGEECGRVYASYSKGEEPQPALEGW
jgi:hypothetical protein